MKCQEAASMLAALADGELDAVQSDVVERHLMDCPACAAEHRRVTHLRARLREEVSYFSAPAALRARIVDGLVPAPAAPSPAARDVPRSRWAWLGFGALGGSAATAMAWVLATTLIASRADTDLADEAVAAHVRATLGGHLVEVASSDQHTVKPWLSSRLDYSPPVLDAPQQGFTLIGGRLDHVERAPVATLVYRYRQHTVDVFVRPLSRASNTPAPRNVRGFNVVLARGSGMEWIGVSDVNAAELATMLQALASSQPPPPPS